MNSRDVLRVLEELASDGDLRRISSDARLTKGIRYVTKAGRQVQVDLGNAVAELQGGRLTLKDAGQARATLVLEKSSADRLLVAEAEAIDGVEHRSGDKYSGSHYTDRGSRLTPGRQACFYIDTADGLRQLLSLYEREGLSDAEILAHFDGSAAFRMARGAWSNDQTAAFCTIARAVHDVGLDWWHVNIDHTPVRFGRKSLRRKAAEGVQGYFAVKPRPRIWFNDTDLCVDLGIEQIFLEANEAAIFDAAVKERFETIAAWKPPTPFRKGFWPDQSADEQAAFLAMEEVEEMTSSPTNLILHGPPGTGKTYATAVEAVRLCGEPVPATRADLMATYRRLCEAGRIEFVTFHQSMAYEDFVEGLRPVPIGEGSSGFELQAKLGIFRLIARRAETSTGPGTAGYSIGDRQVFKMSIGEVANPDDARLFDEAIEGGYTLLGYADIDWSDARFADRKEIIAAIHKEDGDEDADASTGRVQMPHIFRNWMNPGDLVVVSKGNGLFRAIGEILGEYRFVPREGGGYAHRRAVRWLWVDHEGVPVSEIYARGFTQKSAYLLTRSELNVPALERYIASQQDAGDGAPEPFVLIIDEINRANISKVFGELITLLEPDKRLGRENELKVRLPYSGDLFGVPANLHVVGTMNTADRSIALIDKALRRRFRFQEVMPLPDTLADAGARAGVNLPKLLTIINDRIEYLLDREHQIGHAWFLDCRSREALDAAMRERIVPLIAEYFFEDWGKVADVLGGRERNPFLERISLRAPPGHGDEEPRYRWKVRNSFDADAYARLMDA